MCFLFQFVKLARLVHLKVDDMLLLCSLNPEQRSLVWPQTDHLSGFKKLSVLFSNFSGCTNNHLLWLAPTTTPPLLNTKGPAESFDYHKKDLENASQTKLCVLPPDL